MRTPIGIMYLIASGYWIELASTMLAKEIRGARHLYWYSDLFLGGVILGVGAILRWTRWQAQTAWLTVIGSLMAAPYYLAAAVVTVRRYLAGKTVASLPELAVALLPVLLVLALFAIALLEKFRPELNHLSPQTY